MICKTELLAVETFNISAKLTGSGTEGLFTVLMDMTGYPKLFILGIAPATK